MPSGSPRSRISAPSAPEPKPAAPRIPGRLLPAPLPPPPSDGSACSSSSPYSPKAPAALPPRHSQAPPCAGTVSFPSPHPSPDTTPFPSKSHSIDFFCRNTAKAAPEGAARRQSGILRTMPARITSEHSPFASIISGYRFPLPRSLAAIPHSVSCSPTVYITGDFPA